MISKEKIKKILNENGHHIYDIIPKENCCIVVTKYNERIWLNEDIIYTKKKFKQSIHKIINNIKNTEHQLNNMKILIHI